MTEYYTPSILIDYNEEPRLVVFGSFSLHFLSNLSVLPVAISTHPRLCQNCIRFNWINQRCHICSATVPEVSSRSSEYRCWIECMVYFDSKTPYYRYKRKDRPTSYFEGRHGPFPFRGKSLFLTGERRSSSNHDFIDISQRSKEGHENSLGIKSHAGNVKKNKVNDNNEDEKGEHDNCSKMQIQKTTDDNIKSEIGLDNKSRVESSKESMGINQ